MTFILLYPPLPFQEHWVTAGRTNLKHYLALLFLFGISFCRERYSLSRNAGFYYVLAKRRSANWEQLTLICSHGRSLRHHQSLLVLADLPVWQWCPLVKTGVLAGFSEQDCGVCKITFRLCESRDALTLFYNVLLTHSYRCRPVCSVINFCICFACINKQIGEVFPLVGVDRLENVAEGVHTGCTRLIG